MNRTKVEWVKNPDGSQGYSWNPITGCLASCEYCYARQLANGRLKAKYLANSNLPSHDEGNPDYLKPIKYHQHPKYHPRDPFYPRFWPERLTEIDKGKPKGIFVCNMCEFFGDWIPADWQRQVMKVVKANTQHRFYFLSKQPGNLPAFSPFPDNVWLGMTVCNKQMGWLAGRCYYGRTVSAKFKFLSFEPLLEDVGSSGEWGISSAAKVNWVIIGAQTKPYKPPEKEWVESIIQACDKAGVPVFLKNNLKPLLGDNLRQEVPEGKP